MYMVKERKRKNVRIFLNYSPGISIQIVRVHCCQSMDVDGAPSIFVLFALHEEKKNCSETIDPF